MKKHIKYFCTVIGVMLIGEDVSGMLNADEMNLKDSRQQVLLRIEELNRLGGDTTELSRFANGANGMLEFLEVLSVINQADDQIAFLREQELYIASTSEQNQSNIESTICNESNNLEHSGNHSDRDDASVISSFINDLENLGVHSDREEERVDPSFVDQFITNNNERIDSSLGGSVVTNNDERVDSSLGDSVVINNDERVDSSLGDSVVINNDERVDSSLGDSVVTNNDESINSETRQVFVDISNVEIRDITPIYSSNRSKNYPIELVEYIKNEREYQDGLPQNYSDLGYINEEDCRIFERYLGSEESNRSFFFKVLYVVLNMAADAKAKNDETLSLKVKDLFTRWNKVMSKWCLSNEVSIDDQRFIQRIAESINNHDLQDIVGRNNFLLLRGDADTGAVPNNLGIGCYGDSILSKIIRLREQVNYLNDLKAEALVSGRRKLLGLGDSVEDDWKVSDFIKLLRKQDQVVFDILAMKPLLLSELFTSDSCVNNEEEVVSRLLWDMYSPLKGLGVVKDYFVRSCFCNVFSPNLFNSLVLRKVPYADNNVEAIVAAAVEISDDFELYRVKDILGEICNINERGVFGEVPLQMNLKDSSGRLKVSNVWLPKLRFPELELYEETIGRKQNEYENLRQLAHKMEVYKDALKPFERSDDEIRQYYGVDVWSADLWIALRNQYIISKDDPLDNNFSGLINYIREDPENLILRDVGRNVGVAEEQISFWTVEGAAPGYVELVKNYLISLVNKLSPAQLNFEDAWRRLDTDGNNLSLEEKEDLIKNRLAEFKLFPEVINAVRNYNKFAKAYKQHVNDMVSSASGDERIDNFMVGFSPKDMSSFDQEDGIGTKRAKFIESRDVFCDWQASFFEPEDDAIGILKLPNIYENELLTMAGLFEVTNNQESFDPFLRLHSKYRTDLLSNLYENDADSKKNMNLIGDALAEYIYTISFNNMMLHFNSQLKPFHEIVVKDSKKMINGLVYHPKNIVEDLNTYDIKQYKENKLYNISVIKNLVSDEERASFGSDREIKRWLSYYLLKGIYIAITEDNSLTNRYTRRGEVDINGEMTFPSRPISYNNDDIINDLIVPIIESTKRDIQVNSGSGGRGSHENNDISLPNDLGVILQTNGDTSEYLDDVNSESICSALGGLQEGIRKANSNIFRDEMDKLGVYIYKDMVVFILSQFRKMLDSNEISFTPSFFGMLTSRYSHCVNGRMEGTMATFPLLLMNHLSYVNMPFDDIIGLSSYLAVYSVIKEFINFDLGVSRDGERIETNRESATVGSYAMSMIGMPIKNILENGSEIIAEQGLFGFPEEDDDMFDWRGSENLVINCVKHILQILSPGSSNTKVENMFFGSFSGGTPAEMAFSSLLQRYSLNMEKTSRIQEIIDNIEDEDKRADLNDYTDILIMLKKYERGGNRREDYQKLMHDIAKKVITPNRLISWFMRPGNNQLVNLIFDAYKKHSDHFDNIVYGNMTKTEVKQMLTDVLIDSGWVQSN